MTFTYRQKVRVTKGFYKGYAGVIRGINAIGWYQVRLPMGWFDAAEWIWLPADFLEPRK